MRKVKAWLVSDCVGQWSDALEMPVIAFTDKARAKECADKREERGVPDFFDERGWCSVHEIEVVLDD